MTRIVNITGHPLTLRDEYSGRITTYQGLCRPPRLSSKMTEVYEAVTSDGIAIPVLLIQEQEIIGLPAPVPGTLYVASGIVAAAACRGDVAAPGRVRRVGREVMSAGALVLPVPMGNGEVK